MLGLLAAASFAYLAVERWETRHTRHAHAVRRLCLAMAAAVLAATVCILVLVANGESSLYATGGGLAFLIGIIVVRRLGIGTYLGSFLGLLALGFSVAALARNMPPDASLALGFSDAPRDTVDWTVRMMADLPGFGTGAGSAPTLSGLYQSFGTNVPYHAPTTAAALNIEIGLWGSIGFAGLGVVALGLLVRDAFRRGRDSIYPTFGAALLVALGLMAFVDAGLRNDGVSLLAAIAFGLAFAQGESRHA